ncbi:cytochrome P450 [Favolaschia claudopus]|uniref:Cytochrome P450 n=1 Tax=Favolaschia claudopus TaxID=2862362 RepID=A0AAW0BJK4_9AGAR
MTVDLNHLLAVFFGGFVLLFALWRRRSSLHMIPGPESPSWTYGNMLDLLLPPIYGSNEFAWQKTYGMAYRIRGCFGQTRLVISDPLALQHVIRSANFDHAQRKKAANVALYGAGSVPSMKGEEHRRLRAGLAVGFTASSIAEYQSALERIARKISDQFDARQQEESVNVCPLMGNAALAAAAELVFGGEKLDESLIADIVKIMPRWPGQSKSELLIDGIGAIFPLFFKAATLYLQSFTLLREVESHATRVARQIFKAKATAIERGEVDLHLGHGHDLYTRMLLSAPNNKKKLSDEEVIAQTSVFLIAGHETTAGTLSFALLELARHPDFQQKLREELALNQGSIVYDSLPLLNAFIKESLRIYPAAALRERVAVKDDFIPLSEPIITTTGKRITEIPVRRGEQVTLALASYHRLEKFWGEDAESFNPYRWIDGKISPGEAIGPYANLWRFAVLEMQVMLCELIRHFSFGLPLNETVRIKIANTLHPTDANGEKCLRLCVGRVGERID